MNHGFLKVAALSPRVRVADPQFNAREICTELRAAYRRGAKLIVFPELSLTGYTCGDLFLQDTLLEEARAALWEVAAATSGEDALVFVGLPLEQGGKLYDVAAALRDGEILGFVPKRSLPSYAEFYEARHFAPGGERVVPVPFGERAVPMGTNLLFECSSLPGLTVGCELCEDLWVADPPGTRHALAGATVLVNLSASSEAVGKRDYRRMLVTSASARLLAGYVYASAGEGESTQDLVFGGHCMIAENGELLAEGETLRAGERTDSRGRGIYADLDLFRLCHERRRMGTFGAEPEAEYAVVPFTMQVSPVRLERSFPRLPFVPEEDAKRGERCEEVLAIQAAGLAKRLSHTGCEHAVVGISGGLDSALALLVTARSFGLLGLDPLGIRAVTMPCFGTTERTRRNAVRLAAALGATLQEIDIRESVTGHFRDIGQDPEVRDVTYENAQARERTQVLMDLANRCGGLVVGTGDLSELALGWATYNGDHISMYGVNAGVPKTLVRHLVAHEARVCGNETLSEVLRDVLDTPVSPELLPPDPGSGGEISQRTEELVGPYELHDFFLYYMLRYGYPPDKILRIAEASFEGTYDGRELRKWLKLFYRRFFAQQYKRSCLPDGPKVGSVAVSPRGDLRMPSDASAEAWLRQLDGLA